MGCEEGEGGGGGGREGEEASGGRMVVVVVVVVCVSVCHQLLIFVCNAPSVHTIMLCFIHLFYLFSNFVLSLLLKSNTSTDSG